MRNKLILCIQEIHINIYMYIKVRWDCMKIRSYIILFPLSNILLSIHHLSVCVFVLFFFSNNVNVALVLVFILTLLFSIQAILRLIFIHPSNYSVIFKLIVVESYLSICIS
ncbi:MAG: hypothetical protein EXX96DRAFT_563584 [Benjaminiella poitrasii]|nr:MAG: hypothetical protein EXX96DRAFT_563584 [Benjaminiella poitrasii]